MISMTQYLYRIWARRVTFAVIAIFMTVNAAYAQDRPQMRHREETTEQPPAPKKPTKGNARAIGVVEFLPKGGARLIPVALWINGRYYDASLYAANPEPFALQPETVYQAEDYGEPTGLFTVTLPKQINGSWVADGLWKPHLEMDLKLASDAAKEAAKLPPKKPSKAVMTGDSDEGPPVLRRPESSGAASSSKSPDTTQPQSASAPPSPASSTSSSGGQPADSGQTASSSSGRPTLKRAGDDPEPAPATTAASTSKIATRDDDPDRPTLKSSPTQPAPAPSTAGNGSQTASAQPAPLPSSNDNDPGRPVLQRGAPPPSHSTTTTAASKTAASTKGTKSVAGNSASSPAASAPAQTRKSYPAISDAGTYETRSMLYSLSGADRDHAVQELQKLALDELTLYTTKRKVPPLPKTARLIEYDLRAYDLDFSNSATLVFTAKLPVLGQKTLNGGEFDYFVTIVARQDFNGNVQKVFSSVTDSDYLGAVPRMEMVGAVDASANGRGDLLFRQYSDGSISYTLYRVFPYQMQKLFEGGASM